MLKLFTPYVLGPAQKTELDARGHLALPGIITPEASVALTESLKRIAALQEAGCPHCGGTVFRPMPLRARGEQERKREADERRGGRRG